MWDHMYGFTKQYCCASAIYLLYYLDLEILIIIDRDAGEPRHGKYVVDVCNTRENVCLS